MNEQLHLVSILRVLIQGIELGQKGGAYSITDAGILAQAVQAASEIIKAEENNKQDEEKSSTNETKNKKR